MSPAVVVIWLSIYTGLRRCEFTDWSLQHCSCWCTKISDGQVTMCAECSCMRRHRHMEVWLRFGSDTAWRTSMARRPRPGVFQADGDRSSVSERPRATVPVGLLSPGHRCSHSVSSAFYHLGPNNLQTHTDIYLKCICLLDTGAFSTLKVLDDSRTI